MSLPNRKPDPRIAKWVHTQTLNRIEKICLDMVMVHVPKKGAASVAYNLQTGQVFDALPTSFASTFHSKARKWDIYCLSVTPLKHDKKYQIRVGGFTCKSPYNLETLFKDTIADYHIENFSKDNPTLSPFMITIIAPKRMDLSDEQIDNILRKTNVLFINGISVKEIKFSSQA
jgi:hypothetical protein